MGRAAPEAGYQQAGTDFKWVESHRAGEDRTGLFDLSADIGEKRDLSAQKPDILKMVKARYDAWDWEMNHAIEPRGPFRDY